MQQSPKIPFTRDAYEKMQREFDRLTQERVEVMIRLKDAREMGDLSENAAYHYAKFELGSLGRQLRQLKHLLETGEIVEQTTGNTTVGFGTTVTLKAGKKTVKYLIVSTHESNPAERKLSTDSPIGQALIGRKVGDLVVVSAPAGEITYEVVGIE